MGKEGHRRHALDMQKNVHCYFVPYFNNRKLRSVKEETLQDFLVFLKTKKGLAASTVNKARNASFVALRYAKRKKLIRTFDFDAVLRAGGKPKTRGILEKDEVELLFSIPWRDVRSRLVNHIASQTGMRMGEIRALRICDIGSDRIRVVHSWSKADGGLKCPKNGECREIPLINELNKEIMAYIKTAHPFSSIESFLFPGQKSDVPFDEKQIVEDFYLALSNMGISKEQRKIRNIVFHSWRHYCAKNLSAVTSRVIAMAILGHKTSLMFDHYADHIDKEMFHSMAAALTKIQFEINQEKSPIEFLIKKTI
jgi:integrase